MTIRGFISSSACHQGRSYGLAGLRRGREAVLDANESSRVSAAMLAFNKQVNAPIVDPAFIVKVEDFHRN
jgi:hypothetical protein